MRSRLDDNRRFEDVRRVELGLGMQERGAVGLCVAEDVVGVLGGGAADGAAVFAFRPVFGEGEEGFLELLGDGPQKDDTFGRETDLAVVEEGWRGGGVVLVRMSGEAFDGCDGM